MKVIIQIPCFNEAETLPTTLAALPRQLPNCSSVEWLVIDDGSVDGTSEVAKQHGVDHILRFKRNRGLATAFISGLRRAVALGADIVVNTDADNQYSAMDIPKLIEPIVSGKADLVIGARSIAQIQHFNPVKKFLQKLGSAVVRFVSKANVQDAPSGFRAFSRETAASLNVFNDYTYTIETLIQAGLKKMAIVNVPVQVNRPLRPSRLIKNQLSYIVKSTQTMFRIFVVYKPFVVFFIPGSFFITIGLGISLHFLKLYFSGYGQGHLQSLLLSVLLLLSGGILIVVSFIADLISVNRKLLESQNAFLFSQRSNFVYDKFTESQSEPLARPVELDSTFTTSGPPSASVLSTDLS